MYFAVVLVTLCPAAIRSRTAHCWIVCLGMWLTPYCLVCVGTRWKKLVTGSNQTLPSRISSISALSIVLLRLGFSLEGSVFMCFRAAATISSVVMWLTPFPKIWHRRFGFAARLGMLPL